MQGRTEKSFMNVFTGVFGQLLSFVLSFMIRTVFIKTLGEVYLGLNGLFTNILSVLNLTELGIGTAIVLELYRTVATNDENKSKQYLDFYKKAYRIIGFVILFAGLCLTPFLELFINDIETLELVNYRVIFLLYLFNTVFSYFFFAYRESILQANQQEYKARIITYIFKIVEMFLQIVTLLIFKNIYVYLIIPIVLGCVSTIVKGILVGKWYPFIKEKPQGKLSKEEISVTAKNIYSVALYKVSGTVMNSTDNILLSSFISITITGLYSNYLILTSSVSTILSKFFNAFTASLGNLNVEAGNDVEKKYKVFKTLSFLNFWVYGFCSVCFYMLFKPFITFWIGEEFVLNSLTEFVIAFKFLFFGLQETVGVHRAAYGLFYKGRFRPIFTVIVNVFLSVVLILIFPKEYGVAAVLLGTVLSSLFVGWWFDVYVIYKHAFNKKPWEFYISFWLRILYVLIIGLAIKFVLDLVRAPLLLSILIKFIICFILYNGIFILIFHKNFEFKYLTSALMNLLKKFTRK